jgi:hypothetical protein
VLKAELGEVDEQLRVWNEAAKLGADRDKLVEAIGKLNSRAPDEETLPVLRAAATRGATPDTDKLIAQFVAATSVSKRTTSTCMKQMREEYADLKKQKHQLELRMDSPDDVSDCSGAGAAPAPGNELSVRAVRGEWDHQDQVRVAKALFEARNRENIARPIKGDGEFPPTRIFRRPEGGYVQLTRSADGRYHQKSMTIDSWTSALTRVVEYRKSTEKEGDRGRPIPEPVIAAIRGDATLKVPVLQRVIGVPVFSQSGNLNTSPGYDSETGMFLVPEFEILPVPQNDPIHPTHPTWPAISMT